MHKRGTESTSKEEKRGSERASESMGKKEAVGMKLEKYKQERLGYCSAKTKCGKGKALNTMKHKRETKCVRELTRKGKKKSKESSRDKEEHMQKSRSQGKHGRKGTPVRQV